MRKPTLKAFAAFQQKANERLVQVRDSFSVMEEAALTANKSALINAATNFVSTTERFREILPVDSWPGWLGRLLVNARNLAAKPDDIKFIKALVASINGSSGYAKNFSWEYDPDDLDAPDIAKILEEEIVQQGVNEKFDEIIDILQQVVQSEELDRDRAYSDLLSVLTMLGKAKEGGYAEKVFTWNFVKRFIPNLLLEIATATPGLGQCVKAFQKTAEEVDVSFDAVKDAVANKFYAELDRSFEGRLDGIIPIALLTDQSTERNSAPKNG